MTTVYILEFLSYWISCLSLGFQLVIFSLVPPYLLFLFTLGPLINYNFFSFYDLTTAESTTLQIPIKKWQPWKCDVFSANMVTLIILFPVRLPDLLHLLTMQKYSIFKQFSPHYCENSMQGVSIWLITQRLTVLLDKKVWK